MAGSINNWLHSQRKLQHIYELLGTSILDPDREGLLRAVESANREMMLAQSHQNPAVAKRALYLLQELGRAHAILENPVRLTDYSRKIAQQFRREFAQTYGNDPETWDAAVLRKWLTTQKKVHPEGVAHFLELLAENQSETEPVSAPKKQFPPKTISKPTVASAEPLLFPTASAPNRFVSAPQKSWAGPIVAAVVGVVVLTTAGLASWLMRGQSEESNQAEVAQISQSEPPVQSEPLKKSSWVPDGGMNAPIPPIEPPMPERQKEPPPPEPKPMEQRVFQANLYRRSSETTATAFAISPDGLRAVTVGYDNVIRVWDVQNGEQIRKFDSDSTGGIQATSFSPNGRQLLTADRSGVVRLHELDSAVVLHRRSIAGQVQFVTHSADGRSAFVGGILDSRDIGLIGIDLETGADLRMFPSKNRSLARGQAVAFSPDGSVAITGHADGVLRSWNMVSGEEKSYSKNAQDRRSSMAVRCLAIAADNRRAVSGGADRVARAWNVENLTELGQFQLPGGVLAVGFYPATNRAILMDGSGKASVWDLDSGETWSRTMVVLVQQAELTHDAQHALVKCQDGSFRHWDLRDMSGLQRGPRVALAPVIAPAPREMPKKEADTKPTPPPAPKKEPQADEEKPLHKPKGFRVKAEIHAEGVLTIKRNQSLWRGNSRKDFIKINNVQMKMDGNDKGAGRRITGRPDFRNARMEVKLNPKLRPTLTREADSIEIHFPYDKAITPNKYDLLLEIGEEKN